jgi:hypothetical protein
MVVKTKCDAYNMLGTVPTIQQVLNEMSAITSSTILIDVLCIETLY